jgi:hypothetical protein
MMKGLLIIFACYVLLLNLIVSYRLYRDPLYEPWQKGVQFLLIWLLPLLGGFIVSYFLNRTLESQIRMPKYLKWVGSFFLLGGLSKQNGYPSSMNDYGDYNGGVDPGYHCGVDGGCGGGD